MLDENQSKEDLEDIDSLTANFEDDIQEIDLEEDKPLTYKNIFSLVGIGIILFILFFIFLFPLDAIIKSYLTNLSKNSGVTIEFKDIHFPIIGEKRVDSLAIQPSNDMLIKSEELLLDAKFLELINYRFDGSIDLTGLKYESVDVAFLIKSLTIEGNLAGLDDKITRYSGDININLRGGEIYSLPEIPLVGQLKKIELLQGQIKLKIRNGKIIIDLSNINTSWFKIQLSGQIRLNDMIGMSQLDIKVCAQAQEKFAQERPEVAGLLALIPLENGRSCLPIQGILRSPKIEMPSLMSGNPSESGSTVSEPNSDDSARMNTSGMNPSSTKSINNSESGTVVKDEESAEPYED